MLHPSTVNGRVTVYPWATMKVHDAFDVPAEKRSPIVSAGNRYARRHGIKARFTARILKPGSATIMRVK